MERIKKKLENEYVSIKDLIRQGNRDYANKCLLSMPVNLYDLSLDLLDNRNPDIKDKELRSLIRYVHDELSTIKEDEDFEDKYIPLELVDLFPNNIF